MRNTVELFKKYLSKPTQYAILLSGPWGKGKTFYYNNHLKKEIQKTPTYFDNTRKYKPIYVSLFGLKSVEEIQAKIALDLLEYPISSRWGKLWRRRTQQITLGLSRLLLKGFLLLKGLGKVDEIITEAGNKSKKLIDTKDLFICFDDLERRNKGLSIDEFTGYVNTLIENDVKVLIICNEKELAADEYNRYKEKIVGNLIIYNRPTKDVVADIIQTRYSGSLVFKTFILEQEQFIVDLCDKNDNNYRHLIYALDCLHDVYSELKKDILDSKKHYAEKCREQIFEIARFTLFTAMEFRSASLSYEDRDSLLNRQLAVLLQLESKDKIEQILKKYYLDIRHFKYYESIFSYVTGNEDFLVKLFIKEFIRTHNLSQGEILPEYKVLRELDYWNALTLPDEEYRKKTQQMLEYAKQGKYQLAQYQQVFFYCMRFDNPLEYDRKALRKELMEAMTLIAQNTDSLNKDVTSKLSFQHSKVDDDEQEEIRRHGLSIIEQHSRIKQEKEFADIAAPLIGDLDLLYDKYHNDDSYRRAITHVPIFKMIDVDLFFNRLIAANPFSIEFVGAILNDRYPAIAYQEEVIFISMLNNKLVGYFAFEKEKTIKNWTLNKLQNQIGEIQKRFGLPIPERDQYS